MMTFDTLLTQIIQVHTLLSKQAARQVNYLHTIRNWLIGMYIVEFERNGKDRALYGQNTIPSLSERLRQSAFKGMSQRNLYLFKTFYETYPEILQTLSAKFPHLLPTQISSLEPKPESSPFDFDLLLNTLSFSHFIALFRLDNDTKRRFYESEAIANAWTVRELERAIDSLLFERTKLSSDKKGIIAKIKGQTTYAASDFIKDPYVLEFLSLEEKPQFSEHDLETAIINHLQIFLTELGRGFCFEARQKRITFGNTHYRIDLVFYHRILKCHVLIDLKLGKFDHADAGQMNLYLNYYRKNEQTEGDNPPIGIILCADKDEAIVEYAIEGLSNDLFVSKYMLQLPDRETLLRFIKAELP